MTALPVPGPHQHATPVRVRPDPPARITIPDRRRALQLVLGTLWLLDAALQYQPYMFTKSFVSQVIRSSAGGNPAVIADPITWSADVMARHIAACNATFATIQLLIAAGLLYRPTAKAALAASIPWAIGVWWIGEGLSGILTGNASPVTGAPGAVILYAFLALLAWPAHPAHPAQAGPARPARPEATPGPPGRTLHLALWAVLWGGLAGFALQPANRSPNEISAMLSRMEPGEPGWIKATDGFLADVLRQHGTVASIIIAALCGLTATAIASGRLARAAVVLAAILGALFWVTEDFGAIFTGQGTDPNSGLLLIVLAAAFWPSLAAPARVSYARSRSRDLCTETKEH